MSTNLNTCNYLVITISFIFLYFHSSYQQSCNTQDQSSLLAFAKPLSISTSSFPPLNWSSSITCCSWEGVDCDVNGRVISLRLRSRGLEGQITSSIQNLVSLTQLTQLDLSKNLFHGSLPSGIFDSLLSLEIVDLSFNQLNGDFSPSLSSIGGFPTTIFSIDISNNNFHGVMKSTIFLGASNLSSFNSSKNNFNGLIPSSICLNSPILKALDLSYNSFNGFIPSDIGSCSKLKVLNLENNYLRGSILPSLMKCTNLVNLILRRNYLEGNISNLNFSRLVRLQKLDLSRNSFNGSLPESLYSCKTIVALRVATNNLTGQISPKIAQLNSLSFLSLTRNSFTNITSALRILSSCKNLTTLFLGHNFYSETLPSHKAFLGVNGFPNLLFLSLLSCNFAGYFPEWISNMNNLRILHLSHNRITGPIPKWLGSLPKLFALELGNNLLSGEIPHELCLLPALVSANVSNLDYFSFALPVFRIFPGRHTWDQYIVYRPQISLENNMISGEIPSEIGRLRNLHLLYLNGNNLSGEIPVEISQLKNLEQLSLAGNHLTGGIPASLGSLSFLSVFNVSNNDLEGPIPKGRQFDTFQESSYEGNSGLCGDVVQRPCSLDQNEEPENGDEGICWRSVVDGVVVGIALGFSGVLAYAAFPVWYKDLYNLYRHKKLS